MALCRCAVPASALLLLLGVYPPHGALAQPVVLSAGQQCSSGTCRRNPAALESEVPPSRPPRPIPKSIPYRAGPPPSGYQLQVRAYPWLWIPGIAVAALSYVTPALGVLIYNSGDTGAGSHVDDKEEVDLRSLLPVLGGLWSAAACDCQLHDVYLLSSIGQGLGIAAIVLAIVFEQKRFVRQDLVDRRWRITMMGYGSDGYMVQVVGPL